MVANHLSRLMLEDMAEPIPIHDSILDGHLFFVNLVVLWYADIVNFSCYMETTGSLKSTGKEKNS